MSKIAAIIGRVLIAILFVVAGFNKLVDIPGTTQMIQSAGLPGMLALPTAIFEILFGLLLALGFMVRFVSIILAGFVALATFFFHNQLADPMQAAMALKNLAIMGGLFLAFAHSQMWSHYYNIRTEHRGEVALREAERRAHEAELRAARAEGRVEAVHTAPGTGAVVTDVNGDGVPEVRTRRRMFDW